MTNAADHRAALERMYREAPITVAQDASIAITDSDVTVSIAAQPALFHAAGALHGSIIFRALDDAAFFAANYLVEDFLVLTVTFNVVFLRPAQRGAIVARGTVVQASRRTITAKAEATDQEGRLIAIGTGTFMPSTIRLDSLPGYRP